MRIVSLFFFAAVTGMVYGQCDRQATEETKHVYMHLLSMQKTGLMFGHQDDLAYGKGWYNQDGRSDVKDVCGDYPAIAGWELGHLELGDAYSLDSVYFSNIRKGIINFYEKGGINTVSWHLNNPLTGGTAWDVSSKEVVASILEGGIKHELFVQYLNRLADFMLSLKTENGTCVPILFRPYHEHTGSWFWWGRNLCTPEQYKQLWRFTVTYLRDNRHVHNLLYAYSTDRFQTEDEYLERYPGDDIIDMLAFDLYDRGPEYAGVLKNCAGIVSRLAAEKGKPAAVSEAGGPIMKTTDWWTRILLETLRPIPLSYVLVWRNPWTHSEQSFGPFKDHPSADDFAKFARDPHTMFYKDIAKEKVYE